MEKSAAEKSIHAQLLKDGFVESEFGVISASFDNGNGSMNLTLVIAEYAEWYSKQQNAELLAEIEKLKSDQNIIIEQLNNFLSI